VRYDGLGHRRLVRTRFLMRPQLDSGTLGRRTQRRPSSFWISKMDNRRLELEAMRRQLTLVQAVVDTVPAMLAYWNASQHCVFANRAYIKWFGVKPEELIGRTLEELLGPTIYPLIKKKACVAQ
jgi:PAS domain-containing protein